MSLSVTIIGMKITDVVFTNHAIERMQQRGISGDRAWQSVKQPDRTTPGKEKHTTEFIKKFNAATITIIATKNDIGEWVVLSAWMDPPIEGSIDSQKRDKYLQKLEKNKHYDRKMERASFWGKLWITFKKQIGI